MGRVLTLLYHRVNSLQKDINLLAVSPANFYEQMKYLKEHYRIIRFDEDWEHLEQDAVCITFDDGYFDFYQYAVPILDELDIPATIFIATGNLNTQEEYWWDELEKNLLVDDWDYPQEFELQDEFFSCKWETETYSKRLELYDTLHWLMYSKVSVEKRKRWISQLQQWSGLGEQGRSVNYSLQLEKCNNFPSKLVDIGAHTVNHPSLSKLTEKEQRYEITTSKMELQREFGKDIHIFSYPFGTLDDYNKETMQICKECGIYRAASNYPGLWESGCDMLQIPRNIVRDWNRKEFRRKMEIFWAQE